jgi:SprT protein
MNHDELKARILAKHQEVMEKAFQLYPSLRYAPKCNVYFYEKGTTIGLAHFDMRVGYNTHLFAQNPEHFISTIVPHEIAHIVCFHLGIDRGHGANWKRVCRMLGGDAKRLYDNTSGSVVPKLARKRKRYEYIATCGTKTMLSDVAHNRIVRGWQGYRLTRTGGLLLASGFTGKVQ